MAEEKELPLKPTSAQFDGPEDVAHKQQTEGQPSFLQRAWRIINWTPPNCRWDPENPPKFSMSLNVLFAFAGAFTVANLYYNHPILNILAEDFNVPYEKVAQIPTLMQAGYAVGLFFLCPLGDILKRRPFILSLIFFTSSLWIVLCVTKSLAVFSGISFIVAITTVTPQLMLPLVGDLAPPNRRAAALSIVVSGFMLGILIARVLSGIIANYTSWRNVYWLSCGLQYLILFFSGSFCLIIRPKIRMDSTTSRCCTVFLPFFSETQFYCKHVLYLCSTPLHSQITGKSCCVWFC